MLLLRVLVRNRLLPHHPPGDRPFNRPPRRSSSAAIFARTIKLGFCGLSTERVKRESSLGRVSTG